MKVLRRTIIVICIILLIPLITSLFNSASQGKYFNEALKTKVKNGTAHVIEVNKIWKFDKDSINIQRLIITDKNINLRVSCHLNPNGWSFPLQTIELYDDKGKKYMSNGETVGKAWGEDGLNIYDKVPEDCKELTIKIQWYDRKMEVKIPYIGNGKL